MRVAVDPATGGLTAPERTAFEPLGIEALQSMARHEAEGLVTVIHSDGSESIDHHGRFADVAVVRVGPNGKPLFRCVQGAATVPTALRASRPIRAALEER